MARDTPVHTDSTATATNQLPNLVTIVGRGVPASYECTVDGSLEMVGSDPFGDGAVVSGSTIEGAIDVGVTRFRFSGNMANIQVVDWNGNAASDSSSTPTVHVEYGVQT